MMPIVGFIVNLPVHNSIIKVIGKNQIIIVEDCSSWSLSSLGDFSLAQGSVMDLDIIESSTYNSVIPRISTYV